MVNRESWLWQAPEYFNRWRVFSRAFIIFYFWLAFQTAMWFMGIPDPSMAQAGFAGAVISAGAAWFGLYVNSGNISSTMPPPAKQPPLITAQLSSETDTNKLPKYRLTDEG
jgi:hypothetical protein